MSLEHEHFEEEEMTSCRKTAEQEELIKLGLMDRKEKANDSPKQ